MKTYINDTITVMCDGALLVQSPFTLVDYASMLCVLRESMSVDYEIELHLVNDRTISLYSQQYHGVYAPTNILSFESGALGSSAILIFSLVTAHRESILYGQCYEEHILHLLVHGFVHSAGFEHGSAMDMYSAQCYEKVISFFNK